jgi:hypothetical protein
MNISGSNYSSSLRATLNYNVRNDLIRPENKISMYNYMAGWGITINTNYTFMADAGKTIITNNLNDKITNIFSYSLFGQWQSNLQKAYVSCGVSNNKTLPSILSNESTRISLILKSGYKIFPGMSVDVEGGYQPYRETNNPANNFNEKYWQVRCAYEFH